MTPVGPVGPKTSGLAVAALLVGIVGLMCSPLLVVPAIAIALGWRAIHQIDANPAGVKGNGLAITGIVTGVVGVMAGVAVIVLIATGAWSINLDDGFNRVGDANASIAVGDCLDLPSQGTVANLNEQPCGTAHEAELIFRGNLADSSYPGESAIRATVSQRCSDQFETYVGRAFDDSNLEMLYIYPPQSTWSIGDREYLCIAGGAGGAKLPAGTVRNSDR